MEIYKNTKVYIICPARTVTGGPELLHQLGAALQKRRIQSYMYYLPEHTEHPVPERYRKYHVPYTETIEDTAENILIVPETYTTLLYGWQHIRRALWWMSVDNWLVDAVSVMKSNLYQEFRIPARPVFYFFHREDETIQHLTQSEYANQLLQTNQVPRERIASLTDYLNTVFLQECDHSDYSRKQDIIVYNPRKGKDFTDQLIAAAPDLHWAAIENMTPEQVQQLLAQAKVYIDFGTHPGKDRIPREAAISGCCVLTDRRGAAKFFKDVPIAERYKFADTAEEIPAILARSRQVMHDYATAIRDFADYRAEIRQQRQQFEREVDSVFVKTYSEPDRLRLALWQEPVHDTSVWDAARSMPELDIRFLVQDEQAGNFLQSGSYQLEVINRAEAVWQYQEGQIDKILLVADYPEEPRQFLVQQGIPMEDILSLSFS